jgi:predicted nucleotidyltransferase
MFMDDAIRTAVTVFCRELQVLYGARLRRVILFGSRARGDHELDSDVDLCIVLEGPVHPGAEIARTSALTSRVSLEHDVVLSRVFLPVAELEHGTTAFVRAVATEGVAVA